MAFVTQETPTSQQSTNKKNNFSTIADAMRGLGCTAGASQQVSVPETIRASADWPHQGNKTRKKGRTRETTRTVVVVMMVLLLLLMLIFQDVWCGSGIGFSADVGASVGCVVSKKNASSTSRANIDLDKITHKRSSFSFRWRSTVHPETFSFSYTYPDFFTTCSFGPATYPRHIRDFSSGDYSEIMALQGNQFEALQNQIADIMTKALSKGKFEELRSMFGVFKKNLKEEC
ncbi:RING-type E3 ubiquitin transferase [Trifolium repens]|nr:RING-type E3 ubiquitin transferase [Trifolium repens]